MYAIIYRHPEKDPHWKLSTVLYPSMSQVIDALRDPLWADYEAFVTHFNTGDPVSPVMIGKGGPQVCRECWGFGGAQVRGGPGACERCHRIGKAADV